MNPELNEYHSNAKMMPTNTQALEPLFEMLKAWLKAYCKKNRQLPELLIIYRDGVGEGQIKKVLDIELPAVHQVIRHIA